MTLNRRYRTVRSSGLFALGLAAGSCASTPAPVVSPCNGTTVLQQGITDPLIGAAGSGDREAVKNLIAAGHDVNFQECEDRESHTGIVAQRGWTPLMIAAAHGHIDVIQLLLQAGAELNTRESDGTTALALALASSQSAAADLLRSRGAEE